MSAFSIPGMGMGMAGQPMQPQAPTAGAGFVLDIPADPNWEPIETTDLLEKDGYYAARIKSEKAKMDDKPGVWFTFELFDQDVQGKIVQKLLPDPRHHTKDMWFLWRGLMRSIHGNTQGGKQADQYVPGKWVGQYVFFRVSRYIDNSGNERSGVDGFVTKTEWEDAVKAGRHRYDPKPRQATSGAGAVGALPGGTTAFPGLGGGLPGAPSSPMGAALPSSTTPQPSGAAPMQGLPPQQPQQPAFVNQPGPPQQVQNPGFAMPGAAPAHAFAMPSGPPTPPVAPGMTPPAPSAAPSAFAFATPPSPQQPMQQMPMQQPQQPANGVPQPGAAPGGFPGLP